MSEGFLWFDFKGNFVLLFCFLVTFYFVFSVERDWDTDILQIKNLVAVDVYTVIILIAKLF